MTDVIPVKYSSQLEKLETEEQLFAIFSELKKNYDEFRNQFDILTSKRKPINNFSDFLAQAINEDEARVILHGSGNIAGMTVRDAVLEYDLSDVVRLTKYWDIYRARDCFACNNHYSVRVDIDESEGKCKKGYSGANKCGDDFDPHIKNSKGKAARTLQEMVKSTSKI